MKKKKGLLALLPLFIFIAVYLVTSIIVGDFYKMPVLVAALLAASVALVMNRKISIHDKVEVFCKGAGNSNIILMVLVFVLAGAFAGVAKEMGAVDATVNMFLNYLPARLLLPGIFVIACFISISVGTSVGTIAALAPMAVGVADKSGLGIGLLLAAVVGGAMFGDNLSMISDTTIAATRTQGCSMKDKFKSNFLIVLPAAIITLVIYFFASGEAVDFSQNLSFEFIKVIPYVLVLAAALLGVNVLVLLAAGVLVSGAIGMLTGSFDFWGFVGAINSGVMGMSEIILLSIIIGGLIELIKYNGGIDYILEKITKRIKSKKGALLGIGLLVGLIDVCTANNTIAIVTTGPIAKDIADQYKLKPRRVASILDTFSCFFQGVIPYGAQLLVAAGAAGIASVEIIKYLYYPYIMIGAVLIAVIFVYPKLQKEGK